MDASGRVQFAGQVRLLCEKILTDFLVSCGPFVLGVLIKSILYSIPVMELIFQ